MSIYFKIELKIKKYKKINGLCRKSNCYTR